MFLVAPLWKIYGLYLSALRSPFRNRPATTYQLRDRDHTTTRRGILQRGIFATLSANPSVEMPKTRLLNTVAMPESRRVKLFDLEFNSCRFPIGDPRDAEFSFCGQPAPGFGINPYCPTHQKVAFTRATGPSQQKSAGARLAAHKGHAQSA